MQRLLSWNTKSPLYPEISFCIETNRAHNKTNHVPDTSQPMSDESEGGHEKKQYCRSVLRVSVDLPGDSDQPQQPGRFEQTYECRGLSVQRSRSVT